MKQLLFSSLLLLPLYGAAQCPVEDYMRLLKEADRAADKGQYDLAIKKLQSAKTCQPSRETDVGQKIIEVFEKVNAERERALVNEAEAKKQQKIALQKTAEAKLQRDSAVAAKKIAEEAREAAIFQKKLAEKGQRSAENLAAASSTPDQTLALQIYNYNRHQHPLNWAGLLNYYRLLNNPILGFYNAVFTGHKNPIMTLDITSDGKRAISGSLQEPALIWDMEQGKIRFQLNADRYGVNAAVFSSNGEWVLTAHGNVAKLWNVNTGQLLRSFGKQSILGMGIALLGFSPQNEVLTVGNDEQAILWDPNTGEQKAVYGTSIQVEVFKSAFSNDDPEPADIASHQKPDFLSEFLYGKYITNLDDYRLSASIFDISSKQILTVDNNYNRVSIIEKATGKAERMLSGHRGNISVVRFVGDEQMVSASEDGTVKIWDLISGKILHEFSGHGTKITALAWHYTDHGISLLTGSEDGLIKKWDIKPNRPILKIAHLNYRILDNSVSGDGKRLLQGGDDHLAHLIDLETTTAIRQFSGHQDDVVAVALSPNGKTALTGSRDKTAKTWDVDSGNLLATFSGYKKPVQIAAFSPDGKLVMTGCRDGLLHLWDPQTGRLVKKIDAKSVDIESACFSPDSKQVLLGYHNQKPRVVKIHSDTLGREINIKTARRLSYTPDGKSVLITNGQKDGLLQSFDVNTGEVLFTMNKEASQIKFSPDSKLLFTDGLYDTQFGRPLLDIQFFDTTSDDAAVFLPDGKRILLYDAVWCLDKDCTPGEIYPFSLAELRAAGVRLEPADLLLLWEKGLPLSDTELQYLGKTSNKNK